MYQDDLGYAFADINPQAPVHILIVPREHIVSMLRPARTNARCWATCCGLRQRLRARKSLGNGYRIVVNTGEDGGQTVEHLHLHLLGGRHTHLAAGIRSQVDMRREIQNKKGARRGDALPV